MNSNGQRRPFCLIYILIPVFAVSAIFMTSTLVTTTDLGANLEEVAGLTPVAVGWEPVDGGAVPGNGSWHTRLSPGRPVWGIESPSGRFLPVMIDVHIGAVSFYPLRAAYAAGGLAAARSLHIVLGLITVLAAMLIATRLFGRTAGRLAAVLLATSPVFFLVHVFARPDVQGAFLYPMLGVLALHWYAGSRNTVLLCVSAFMFGLGVATKNTALWTATAAAVSLAAFGARPRGFAEAGAAVASFLLPLLPQAWFFASTPSFGLLTARIGGGRTILEAFSTDRLSFFASHFILSVAGFGSAAPMIPSGGGVTLSMSAAAAGVLIIAAVVAAPCILLVWGTDRRQKMFAAGFAVLSVQYLAFYYIGDTYFLLLIPWVVILLAGVSALAWRAPVGMPVPLLKRALGAAVAAAWALVLANQAVEVVRFAKAVSSPSFQFMRLSAQKELVKMLEERRVERPWTVSYTFAGVLETLSNGRIRPRHAYNIIRGKCTAGGGSAEDYISAWDAVFKRMGGGVHHVVAQPNPSVIDMNPCRKGNMALAVLGEAAAKRGGKAVELFSVGEAGNTDEFKVVEVVLP